MHRDAQNGSKRLHGSSDDLILLPEAHCGGYHEGSYLSVVANAAFVSLCGDCCAQHGVSGANSVLSCWSPLGYRISANGDETEPADNMLKGELHFILCSEAATRVCCVRDFRALRLLTLVIVQSKFTA